MKKHILSVAVLALAVMLSTFTSCRKPQAEDTTPAKEGLYLGIVGFNSELYTMPLGLLNQDTKHNFENFVDGLSMQNGTILYHAVNTGLNSLAAAKIPENLINVSVVTFTDGLDQGSYVLSENYNSGSEYLTAVNRRINNELIGGTNISAYSIGVRGSDVSDIDSFRNNLKKLSSDPVHNVFEVNNMNEASDMFARIAQQLYNQSTLYNEHIIQCHAQAAGTGTQHQNSLHLRQRDRCQRIAVLHRRHLRPQRRQRPTDRNPICWYGMHIRRHRNRFDRRHLRRVCFPKPHRHGRQPNQHRLCEGMELAGILVAMAV